MATSPVIPNENYVGQLQEKCDKFQVNFPLYNDISEGNKFKYICKLNEWSVEGTGLNKKFAKHNAALQMIKKIENENLFNNIDNKTVQKDKKSVSMIFEYCKKKDKAPALYSDKPEENGLFVCSCTFEGFTAEGKGKTKKEAKEKSADIVAKHFNIHQFFANIEKSKNREELLKNPSQILHELCQSRRLEVTYQEEKVKVEGNKEAYVITCKVGDHTVQSDKISSKKAAKMDAANKMFNLLNTTIPGSSLDVNRSTNGTVRKRLASETTEEDSDTEPLHKLYKSIA